MSVLEQYVDVGARPGRTHSLSVVSVFSTSAPAGPPIATWPFSTLWDDDWSCIGGSEALIADLLQGGRPAVVRSTQQL